MKPLSTPPMRPVLFATAVLLFACGNAEMPTTTQPRVEDTIPTLVATPVLASPAPTEFPIPTFYVISTPKSTAPPHPDWRQVFASLPSADVANTCNYWLSFWSARGLELEELAEFVAWHPGVPGQELLPARWEGLSAALVYDNLRYDLPLMSPAFHQVAEECSEQAPRGFVDRLDRINEDLQRLEHRCLIREEEEPRELCSYLNPYYFDKYPDRLWD